MYGLNILADENIPFVAEAFSRFGAVQTCSGREIPSLDLRGVDVLLVRSVTPIGPTLLEGSSVRFVGSATIGTDHVDRDYLRKAGIHFAHAPGSNADSVADYVVVALLTLARRKNVSLAERTVGIVGCGNIGSRLARRLSALGLTVLRNDPPRAERIERKGGEHEFVGLDTIVSHADILSLHVPLTSQGPHPTHHLVDADVLDRLGAESWLLNTSRGAVVDGTALLKALQQGDIGAAVLDVWENEPSPDSALVRAVDIATPHIAGYALDGKVRGTSMLYEAFCDFMGVAPTWNPTAALSSAGPEEIRPSPPDPRLPSTDWLYHLACQGYNLSVDDTQMRAVFDETTSEKEREFTALRKRYRRRRELKQHTLLEAFVPPDYREAAEKGVGVQLV